MDKAMKEINDKMVSNTKSGATWKISYFLFAGKVVIVGHLEEELQNL